MVGFLLLVGSAVLLTAGSELFAEHASAAGRRFGVTALAIDLGLRQSVAGLTFVALATTAELFALVWAALRRGIEELALAGMLGSAVYNATARLGIAALEHPIHASGMVGQAWLATALPPALVVYTLVFKRVGRVGGGLLVAGYGACLPLTFARG